MQQRRVRLGDILDDYCPRERRVTNHAVVAMIDDEVKQTRCATCDAEHEYKEAKVPAPRRKKSAGALAMDPSAPRPRQAPVPATLASDEEQRRFDDDAGAAEPPQPMEMTPEHPPEAPEPAAPEPEADSEPSAEDEWPVHRPLIRATLPRPEGQTPERKVPDFTFRPAGGRFENPRNGRHRGHRPMRHAQGQSSGQPFRSGPPRAGSGQNPRSGSGQGAPRHGAGQGAQGQRQGNRPGGQPAGRGGRPAGPGRNPQHRPGSGRKRGR